MAENVAEIVQTASTADLSVVSLILSSDIVGKLVLLVLFILSVWSWAIIINKYMQYKATRLKMQKFERIFWSGQVLDELLESIKDKIDNPLTALFVGAMGEFKRNNNPEHRTVTTEFLRNSHKERMHQTMYLIRHREIERLECKLGFLATVGSSAVFIGLFGTVWGIIHSFQSIAASKNTSLAVVAPGIAEALIATAIGLFVAIPAVIFYNYLISQVDSISNNLDDFIGELGKLLSRAIDEIR